MDQKIRLGIVGCGDIANLRYISSIPDIPNLEFVAACDVVEDRAVAAVNKLGGGRHYTDYRDLVADENVDAVIVTVPHSGHAPVAREALRHGKHVLVEKPIATNYRDALSIAEEAEKAGKVFFPMPYNYFPAFRALKGIVSSGAIGQVSQMWLNLAHCGPTHANWFYQKAIAHNGVTADLGIYLINFALGLFGPVRQVSGVTKRLIDWRVDDFGRETEVDVEDNSCMRLQFTDDITSMDMSFKGSGTIATISTNWCTGVPKDGGLYDIRIHATEGFVFADVIGGVVHAYSRKGGLAGVPAGKLRNAELIEVQMDSMPEDVAKKWEGPIILADFAEAVRKGGKVKWHDMALQAIEIIDKVYLSSDTGRVQTVESTFA
jgi:predicted dehydrogenase